MGKGTWLQPVLEAEAEKRCSRCDETKSLTEFYRRASARDGFRSQCKRCVLGHNAEHQRELVLASGRRVRHWQHRLIDGSAATMRGVCAACGPVALKWKTLGGGVRALRCAVAIAAQRGRNKYVRTLRAIEAKRLRQTVGACELCGSSEGLVVDHCHKTGRVRGVLCRLCNWGLGQFRDRPDLLRAAANYLER